MTPAGVVVGDHRRVCRRSRATTSRARTPAGRAAGACPPQRTGCGGQPLVEVDEDGTGQVPAVVGLAAGAGQSMYQRTSASTTSGCRPEPANLRRPPTDFGRWTRDPLVPAGLTTISTRWNSLRSEYPVVAIDRRSAPTMFIVPSVTWDGPNRICSSVPTVPRCTRAPRGRVGVPRLGTPVPAATRRLAGPRQRHADHHRVGTAGDRLGDVAAVGHAAVADDVHVAATGLVHVVAASRGDVGHGRGHRNPDAEHLAGRVRRAAADADEDAGCARTHQVQCGLVGRAAADDDRHVELVDELLEVERGRLGRHVLGRDDGARG